MKKLLTLTLIASLFLTACTEDLTNIGFEETPTNDESETIPAVTDADWSKGNLEADVVLVEYSDFQCPACKAREQIGRAHV